MFQISDRDDFLCLYSEQKTKSSAVFFQKSALRAALLGVFAVTLAACQEEQSAENEVRPVKSEVVQQQAGERIKRFSGDIRPHTESILGFRVAGKIVEQRAAVGDRVKAGEVIARLDNTDLVLSENSAKAAVQSAKTRLAVARDALSRAEKLQPKGYTPSSVVDQRKLEVDAAEAALQSAEAQARQATNATGYAVLKADAAGVITTVHAEAGQIVAAGASVVSLAEAGGMELALDVPEQDVARLSIGQKANVTLWANDDVTAAGRISEIAGRADPGSRTYAVRVAMPDPPPAMRLGMTATAALQFGGGKPFMPVPLTALTEVDGRQAVYVADRTRSTVSLRFIEADGVTDDTVKVVSGLQPGEVVVTGGVQFLTDGMQVRLPQALVQRASAPQAEIDQ